MLSVPLQAEELEMVNNKIEKSPEVTTGPQTKREEFVFYCFLPTWVSFDHGHGWSQTLSKLLLL